MPSHIMDQRHLSSLFMPSTPSSFLTEEVCLPSERQLGFRKAENVQDQSGLQGMPLMSGRKSVSSSPLEKLYPVGGNYISYSELPRTFLFMGQKERIFAGNHMLGTESTLNLSMTGLEASNQDILPQTNLFKQPAANGLHFENSLFSGSLSEAFGKKVGLMSSDRHFGKSVDATDTVFKEDEPLESSKEVEAQTIGDLLPNDDDLLSGVIDDIEFVVQTNSGDEDDLFYSGGRMELESDESFNCKRASGFISAGASNSQIEDMNIKFPSELMYGKHPSRTLILRNIDSNIDGAELKILFEQFGDIRALYMASKHQGFVLVSYYDIRASNNAMKALQQRKIDIHYYFFKDNASDKDVTHATLIVSNLDSSVTNDDMHQIFGSYGEIKEIFYDPHCQNQRAIEFYDIRAAEAALCALNMSDIAGRRIKAELGCPGVGWRCLGKLLPLELGKEGSMICRNGDSSNIPLLEIGDFGISVNKCCPINEHQYVLNNSNANFHQPPGSLMWQNSLSFLNNIPAPSPQLYGLPRGPSHMLNTFIPLNHYQVGSAPALNPSIWERCSTYAGDCMEATSFHPGSLGNMGFCGSPQMHPLGIASHSISPNAGLNCMDPSISLAHVGSPSPQQRFHMLHGRNRMSSLPVSYDAPGERIRTHQSDAGANQADNKKQFELDIDRIISGEDSRTTLMIKNIPNKYTSKMLLATIDEHHKGTYDFIYLPIDFKNKCNVGYAFINLTEPKNIIPFHQAFNGKKWEKFNSEKVASLAYARIQGKSALIAHFQNSSLMNEDKRCRPILFHSDGPNAGDQEPFPVGTHIRSRPGRFRTTNNEDHHQRSPSDSGNGDDLSNSTYSSSSSIKDLE